MAALVVVGVVYVAQGLRTAADPDYTVAVVTAEALPDAALRCSTRRMGCGRHSIRKQK